MEVQENGAAAGAVSDSPAGFDVDSFMSNLEGDKPSLPGDSYAPENPAPAAKPTTQAPATQTQTAQEIEFIVNGKPVKATLDQAKQWASKGYHYNQEMARFKAEQEAFTKQRTEIEQVKARYAELEDFASKNPGWIDHVNQAWQQAQSQAQAQGQQLPPAVAQEFQALKQQLGELSKFKSDSEAQRKQQQTQQEDQTLNSEIQTLREQFKDLDWNAVSPDGHALDMQVLKFMQDNHIGVKADGSYVPGSFERAFKAFNHDQLVKRAEERAKEAVVKAKKVETKLGLLGQSSTPKKGQITHAENYKHKSLSELAEEAIKELELGA
jgi:methionine-rich copper-binding protein CopC